MTRLPGRTVRAKADARPVAAVEAKAAELNLTGDEVPVTTGEAAQLVAVAVAAAPATQVRRPWRSTLRTALQVVLGLLPMVPLIVDASGLDDTAAPVAGALAISAGAARVMALPEVEAFLQRFVPWLAASPRPAGT